MKTTQLKDITSAALFLIGLGLITTSLGIRSLQAHVGWHTTKEYQNRMCVATDPDPSCATCEGGSFTCEYNITNNIDEGICQSNSGSQGLICLEGWWDCGRQVDCVTEIMDDTLFCEPLTGLCSS